MFEQAYPSRSNSRVMKSGGANLVTDPAYFFQRINHANYMITEGNPHYRSSVRRIEFHDALPRTVRDTWDASEAGDCSVVAWLTDGVLHFAAKGGVIAPEDSSWLFAHYVACVEIRFNGCFDTSRVTNMNNMFWDCASLTSLDLSSFDTSKVTNMSGMFKGCASLTELNLSGFDVSRVKDMKGMFEGCGALTSLDVTGLATPRKIEPLRDLLRECIALRLKNIRGFAALPPRVQGLLTARAAPGPKA